MIENMTEVESCMRVCLTNITDDWFVQPEVTETPYIKGATAHCYLEGVGRPVFHAHSNTFYGAWMRDAYPKTGKDSDKRWLAPHFQGDVLHEYTSESDLRRQNIEESHILPYVYSGTNPTFFNGSFYYQRVGYPSIIKYDIATKRYKELFMGDHVSFRKKNVSNS